MAKRYKSSSVGARRTSSQKAASRRNLQNARRHRHTGAKVVGGLAGAAAFGGAAYATRGRSLRAGKSILKSGTRAYRRQGGRGMKKLTAGYKRGSRRRVRRN